MSLPLFRSAQSSAVVAAAGNPDPLSTSLVARNESWASVSSLHSLPEPFLCRNDSCGPFRGIPDADHAIQDSAWRFPDAAWGIPDPARASLGPARAVPGVNGWHEVPGDPNRRPVPPHLVNGYATEEPRQHEIRNAFGASSQSHDSGTLRAASVGREIDANDDRRNFPMTAAETTPHHKTGVSFRSDRPPNSVLGQLIRAKSVTSKTLRRLGPKFGGGGSAKSAAGGDTGRTDGRNAVVRRSSSIAQRFRAFRAPAVENREALGGRGGGFQISRRTRERSPLAFDTPVREMPTSAETSSAKLDPGRVRDPVRRVLFGASSLKDGRRGPDLGKTRPATVKTRLSFHGDPPTCDGPNSVPCVRPRSTEPPSRSVHIEPASYRINHSSPITIAQSHRNFGVGSGSYVPPSRSPRMASPESSSLSSGSPMSVFSAAVPRNVGVWHGRRDSGAALTWSAVDSTASMSDLSLWEMPKLDIDLVDQMFVAPNHCGYTARDTIPVVCVCVYLSSRV